MVMMVALNPDKVCESTFLVNALSGALIVSTKPVISYDSQYVILSSGASAKVFSIQSGESVQTLSIHTKPIISIRPNKKNDLQVFTCSDDGLVVRWDYTEGQILQIYDLKMEIAGFYAPTASGPWFVKKRFEDHYRLYSLVPRKKGFHSMEVVIKLVEPKENTIDFSDTGTFCASVYRHTLAICKFPEKVFKWHKTGEFCLTCVVCHPTDYVIATGDDIGRIILWTNALDSNHPIRSIFHWHTLPVADLAFSAQGSYLYSGGGEASLVKWGIFSEERFILPRMGSPILFVSSSGDNKIVITAHQDNVLQVVDAQRTIIQIIQGLTRSPAAQPISLLFHPRLRALVLSGKPGHLQFYDIEQDKHLFNLDICGQNLISQEREVAVFNLDVHRAALDETGLWLATAEFWSSGDTSPQMWLKFWLFDEEKQTYILNTNVILPHYKEINCILFRPRLSASSAPLVVTTSSDGRFKVWTLAQNEDEKSLSWSCESMGCYRGLPAGQAAFSDDGSLLAVAFGNAATLWGLDGLALKGVLCWKRTIKQLLFGHHSCCHYLVCQDGESITAWNVLTLSVTWVIHNEVQVLTSDAVSGQLAAFCKNQNLIIFSPDNPKPLHHVSGVSEKPILSAVFARSASSQERKATCFHPCSRLFFLDSDQNLLSLLDADEDTRRVEKVEKKITQQNLMTPFGMLQAEHKASDVQRSKSKTLTLSLSKDQELIIQSPSLQNPFSLCSSILPSLLLPAKNNEDQKPPEKDESNESKDELDPFRWMPITLQDLEAKFLDFGFLSTAAPES